MPLTVITLKSVPPALRGDLTKWMQEIATGVYVGNFNSRVREELWERVKQSAGTGEATLSYACRNEIGYVFDTFRTERESVDYDGIPLVRWVKPEGQTDASARNKGFSDAAKFRKAKKFAGKPPNAPTAKRDFVVLDIETTGLDETRHQIIEIGVLRVLGDTLEEFQTLVSCDHALPHEIVTLTGITDDLLVQKGMSIEIALESMMKFIGALPIVGYGVNFDTRFINAARKKYGQTPLNNPTYDLLKYVKKEKMFLPNYRLETALGAYGIGEAVPHRAIKDARLTYQLSLKVNKFLGIVK